MKPTKAQLRYAKSIGVPEDQLFDGTGLMLVERKNLMSVHKKTLA